eukprot:1817783-Pyramimonas_sp.AAC.1
MSALGGGRVDHDSADGLRGSRARIRQAAAPPHGSDAQGLSSMASLSARSWCSCWIRDVPGHRP